MAHGTFPLSFLVNLHLEALRIRPHNVYTNAPLPESELRVLLLIYIYALSRNWVLFFLWLWSRLIRHLFVLHDKQCQHVDTRQHQIADEDNMQRVFVRLDSRITIGGLHMPDGRGGVADGVDDL